MIQFLIKAVAAVAIPIVVKEGVGLVTDLFSSTPESTKPRKARDSTVLNEEQLAHIIHRERIWVQMNKGPRRELAKAINEELGLNKCPEVYFRIWAKARK